MLNAFCWSLLFAVIGGVNPDVAGAKTDLKAYLRGWLRGALWCLPVTFGIFFFVRPVFLFPFIEVLLIFSIFWGVSIALLLYQKKKLELLVWAVPAGLWVLTLFMCGVRFVGSTEYLSYKAKAGMLGEVEVKDWKEGLEDFNRNRAKIVDEEQATRLGRTALGGGEKALGAQFHVGKFAPHLFPMQGKQLQQWVASLAWNGFWHWLSNDIPGYVVVSAEDPTQEPRLVSTGPDGEQLQFELSPEGYLWSNLDRYAYWAGDKFSILSNRHGEVDDAGRFWWVYTRLKPGILTNWERYMGVQIVDPQTRRVQIFDRDEVPAWIDGAMPEEIFIRNLKWWCLYKGGIINAQTGKEDVLQPTPIEVPSPDGQATQVVHRAWLVRGRDGESYLGVGLTSLSEKDDSIVGYMLVNTRTGKATRYSMSGQTEEDILTAVKQAVTNHPGYHGTQAIPYNFGIPAWLVPILSADARLEKVAIVDGISAKAIVGESMKDVLLKFSIYLRDEKGVEASFMATETTKWHKGLVQRIGGHVESGNSIYTLRLDGLDGITLIAPITVSRELSLLAPGDLVRVGYEPIDQKTGEVVVIE